jgi:hypothetical protein
MFSRPIITIASRFNFLLGVVLCLAVAADGQARADQFSETWPAAKKANVKLGDADYPQLKPQPTRMLRLIGDLPKSLHIEFLLHFEASSYAGGTIQSGNYRGYVERAPVFPLFSVTESLRVVRDDSSYSASIPMDKYLPGKCGWHLYSVGYRIIDGGKNFSDDWFAGVFDPKVNQGPEQEFYRGQVNTWCTRKPFRGDPGQHQRCAVFPILKEFVSVRPETIASIPSEKRAAHHVTWVFPDTQLIEMNFYDLDSVKTKFNPIR